MHREHRASAHVPLLCGVSNMAFDAPIIVRCGHCDSCCNPMIVAECKCAAHSPFCIAIAKYVASPTCKSSRAWSAPCARDLASTARDKTRSYLREVIDFCAAEIIAVRSELALSRVTRSCREGLSLSDPPACMVASAENHCAGEHPRRLLA